MKLDAKLTLDGTHLELDETFMIEIGRSIKVVDGTIWIDDGQDKGWSPVALGDNAIDNEDDFLMLSQLIVTYLVPMED